MEAIDREDVYCTLYSGEHCEDHSQPVCTIGIGGGRVDVYTPDLSCHDRHPTVGTSNLNMGNLFAIMQGNHSGEHGWPAGWVEEFGAKSTATMKEIAPGLFESDRGFLTGDVNY